MGGRCCGQRVGPRRSRHLLPARANRHHPLSSNATVLASTVRKSWSGHFDPRTRRRSRTSGLGFADGHWRSGRTRPFGGRQRSVSHTRFRAPSLQGTPETMGCQRKRALVGELREHRSSQRHGITFARGDGELRGHLQRRPTGCGDDRARGVRRLRPRRVVTHRWGAERSFGVEAGSRRDQTIVFPVADKGVGAFRVIGEVRPHHEGPWLQFAESVLGGSSCRPVGETTSTNSPRPSHAPPLRATRRSLWTSTPASGRAAMTFGS